MGTLQQIFFTGTQTTSHGESDKRDAELYNQLSPHECRVLNHCEELANPRLI